MLYPTPSLLLEVKGFSIFSALGGWGKRVGGWFQYYERTSFDTLRICVTQFDFKNYI
jgi:hypothetical protein